MSSPVMLETVILEQSDDVLIAEARRLMSGEVPQFNPSFVGVLPPKEATRSGVSQDVYDGMRAGLATACVDVVPVFLRTESEPAVPLIKRAAPPFAGHWWMYGGALFNFHSMREFARWKMVQEGGLSSLSLNEFEAALVAGDKKIIRYAQEVLIVGVLGVYRTTADDTEGTGKSPCDTVNTCYVAIVSENLNFDHDARHTDLRLVTAADVAREQFHPYVARTVGRALTIAQRLHV